MRALLDTHMRFSGGLRTAGAYPEAAYRAIADEANEKLVSAASAWEIATKHRLGKLPGADALAVDIPGAIAHQGFEELHITVDDATRAGALPGPLRDPFDRSPNRPGTGPQPRPHLDRPNTSTATASTASGNRTDPARISGRYLSRAAEPC